MGLEEYLPPSGLMGGACGESQPPAGTHFASGWPHLLEEAGGFSPVLPPIQTEKKMLLQPPCCLTPVNNGAGLTLTSKHC